MRISIGIPTCNRPYLLLKALSSCLAQTYPPKEIIIGDDSKNDESWHLIKHFINNNKTGIAIKYIKNSPFLGQGKNVNKIIASAAYEKFLLLHDDDLLEANALELLVAEFNLRRDIHVVYGKHYIIDKEGKISLSKSEQLNRSAMRTTEQSKSPLTAINAAIVQQFPNNAFLIDTTCFKKVKYYIPGRQRIVGTAVDFDFGLRLALNGFKFYFTNNYTAQYRLTPHSISTSTNNNAALRAFNLIKSLPQTSGLNTDYREQKLTYLAPAAFAQAMNGKQFSEAKNIYFSKWHRARIFTLGGGNRSFQLLSSYVKTVLEKKRLLN